MVLTLLGTALAVFFAVLSPIVWPWIVASRLEPAFPRPVLFVLTCATFTYGVWTWFALLLVPFQFLDDWLLPSMLDAGQVPRDFHEWFGWLYYVMTHQFLIGLTMNVVVAFLTTNFIRARWRSFMLAAS